MQLKRITIFCGSSSGTDSRFEQMAFDLGRNMANRGIGLVYGGAKIGLMGAVANGALSEGGEVIGVLPNFLSRKEILHEGLSELIMVDTMHERKALMDKLSDGAIALPGGFGTLEELLEMLTWSQLGLHGKPLGLFNMNGFYDDLLHLFDKMIVSGFLKQCNKDLLLVHSDFLQLLDLIENYETPDLVGKWIEKN
jgi:uncharacterized protein (TIGR00730 family)